MKLFTTVLTTVATLGLISTARISASAQFLPDSLPEPLSSLVFIQADAELDIVDTAMQLDSIDTFIDLMSDLGMAEDLRGYGRFTVFAPSDAAFAAVDADIMAMLSSDRDLLADVLAYHIIALGTPLYSEDITSTVTVRTLERSEVEIRERRRSIYVNEAEVIEADIEASNGVIHIIDQVLLPPDVLTRVR
ncbi:MAG: fasciclin domain-containing protein [Elainellaceae cyanobacterium]